MTIDEAIDYVDDINETVSWTDSEKTDEDFFISVQEMLEEFKEAKKKLKTLNCIMEFCYNNGVDDMEYKLLEMLKDTDLRDNGIYVENLVTTASKELRIKIERLA